MCTFIHIIYYILYTIYYIFIRIRILQLHEDMNRVKLKPYLERPEGDGTNDTAIAKEAWSKHLQRDNSVITDHIGSLMRSELTCPDCNKVITCLIHLLNTKLYYNVLVYRLTLPSKCMSFTLYMIRSTIYY